MKKAGTIVVGVDGSASSMRALAWATEQAVAEHRALTIAHAIDGATPAHAAIGSPEEAGDTLSAGGREVLDEARRRVLHLAPDLEVHEVTELVDPREMLLELSRDATMVVLGSRGRGQLRSLLLGSVGVALVRHAQCPVVVHRPGNAGTVRNGIVVGVEASEGSAPVVEFAYREASLRHLPLAVVHSYWDFSAGATAAGIVYESVIDVDSERLALAETMAGLGEKYPDVSVSTQVVRGLPHQVLAQLGERMNLIVVGSHRSGRAAQIVYGSVSVSLVEHASCPVAVVPVSVPL